MSTLGICILFLSGAVTLTMLAAGIMHQLKRIADALERKWSGDE